MKFKTILADPAWQFTTYSDRGKGRSPEQHYPCMSLEALKALPVAAVADRDSLLLMWATMPMLPQAIGLGHAWGFHYKTAAFTWAKCTLQGLRARHPLPLTDDFNWRIGNGYWTRANAEICLLFTRGRPRRKSASVRQLIVAPITRHSAKPEIQYERIEALVDGPYLELFARQTRAGWVSLGFDLDGRDLRESLPTLAAS